MGIKQKKNIHFKHIKTKSKICILIFITNFFLTPCESTNDDNKYNNKKKINERNTTIMI